eukprot:333435_1
MSLFEVATSSRYAHQEWFWWIYVLISHITTFLLILLWIWQSINVFFDLCTQNRKCLQWRSLKPPKDRLYIMTTLCSYITICLYVFTSICIIMEQWRIFSNICDNIVIIGTDFYLTAKAMMYLAFILRLHTVYRHTHYAYNYKFLIIAAIIITIVNIMNCIFTAVSNGIDLIFYDNLPFALHCNAYYPFIQYIIVGGADIIISISFLIAFVYPLNSIQRMMSIRKSVNNLMYLGIKSLILTGIAAMSTLMFLLSLLLSSSLIFGTTDTLVNSICIILMTPYYNDTIYYKKVCCLWIKIVSKCVADDSDILTITKVSAGHKSTTNKHESTQTNDVQLSVHHESQQ